MPRRSFDGSALYVGPQTPLNPSIPDTLKKEEPVTEHLVPIKKRTEAEEKREHELVEQHEDRRFREVKPYEAIYHPLYNQFYSSARTEDDWRFMIDNFASGTITTIAATAVTVAVSLKLALDHKRLSEWPNATQLFLCIRQFSLSPQTATFATVGSIDLQYNDTIGGQTIPLGDTLNNGSFNLSSVILIPTPITDPGQSNVGQLIATLNSGATVGTYFWQLGFSYAYLTSSNEPHESKRTKGGDIHKHGSTPHTRIMPV